jgi:DNA-binding NarL/FixJ family response regulator
MLNSSSGSPAAGRLSPSSGSPARRTRVAIVDDEALVRMGLRTLIGSEGGLELVGEAADGRAGLAVVRQTRPDVVLCDIRMPELDGLGLLAEVAADPSLPGVRVIMLTTFELDEYVFEALRSGASGFLLKDTDPDRILDAIRVVAEGGSLLSPSVTRRVIERFGAAPAPRPHPQIGTLTGREREIVALVATGRSNAEIADLLVLSPDTVRTHVSRAMVKLAARDRAQLVVFAIQSGLEPDR